MVLESLGKTRAFITHIEHNSALSYTLSASIDNFKENRHDVSYMFSPGCGAYMIFPHISYRSHYIPFLSSNDDLPEFRIGIKIEQGWSENLGVLHRGDAILLSKPKKNFSYIHFPQTTKLVFLVAGSGIFPVISMLHHLQLRNINNYAILILWGAHNRINLVQQNELQDISGTMKGISIIPTLTHDPLWQHEKGRIDEEKLQRLVPSFFGFSSDMFLWESASYWISGNKAFASSMIRHLHNFGALKRSIHIAPYI